MSAPAWLLTARDHLRRNYAADGLAESLLWALFVRGFDPFGGSQAPESHRRAQVASSSYEHGGAK